LDDKTLASGSDDGRVRLWDLTTGVTFRTLEGHSDRLWAVAFSPDDKTLVSASDDKTVRLWDLTTKTARRWDSTTEAARCTLRGHLKIVWAVAFSPDGKTLASGSLDETVRL